MAEKIKVIIKEPGKAPEIKTITNDLGTLQSIVGGYIETVTLAVMPFRLEMTIGK